MKIKDYGVQWNVNKPPEPVTLPPLKEGDRWYCPNCHGDLFGIFHDGQLHIKYRERNLIAQGTVTVTCRRCGLAGRISTAQVPIAIVSETVDEIMHPEEMEAEDVAAVDQPDVNATWWAVNYAKEHGIDLSQVKGTGKNGKITVKDLGG